MVTNGVISGSLQFSPASEQPQYQEHREIESVPIIDPFVTQNLEP